MLVDETMIKKLHKENHGKKKSPFDKEVELLKMRGDLIKKLAKEKKVPYTIHLDANKMKYSETVYDIKINETFGVEWWTTRKNLPLKTLLHWDRLYVQFYFPEQNILCNVVMSTCLQAFTKPQRAVIVSFIRTWLRAHGKELNPKFEMSLVGIPHHLRRVGALVGAAPTDITHEQVGNLYANGKDCCDGYIYADKSL